MQNVIDNIYQQVKCQVHNGKVARYIPELAKSTSLTIVSVDYVITYEQFWNAYDNKVNNKRALALWDKLSHVDKVAAFVGIKIYNRHLQKNPWKTKADPDTYLRNRSWENNYK